MFIIPHFHCSSYDKLFKLPTHDRHLGHHVAHQALVEGRLALRHPAECGQVEVDDRPVPLTRRGLAVPLDPDRTVSIQIRVMVKIILDDLLLEEVPDVTVVTTQPQLVKVVDDLARVAVERRVVAEVGVDPL